ncbi:MAG: hypothetical protein ABIR17_12435 [Pseudolysinimonas sp.]|uniref:hypothetical protein n=1 Tax=Pseudolysinimonas sp. TaxID=2680009 RepID=UPI003264A67D
MFRTPLSVVARTRTVATTATSLALALTFLWCGSTVALAAPASAEAALAVPLTPPAQVDSGKVNSGKYAPVKTQLPTLAVDTAPTWSIQVDTTGYQNELDRCLWVRMDFIDVVPIVGKHNFCGGDIILDMTLGQTVQLSGLGVDGTYVVTGDRQVFSGEPATEATANLTATVILQTCYFDKSKGMRFVTLSLLPEVPRVLVGVS